ncbi:MAG: hypothetical protein F4169_15480 [Gammaproteobacteria bacterium]|nr:hypothetical protein [Gammaproteobacteria bacterium]
MLVAFGDTDTARSSREAFELLRTTLADGQRRKATIGGRGFSTARMVIWHPDVGLWSLLDRNETPNRFWCCYGIEDPGNVRNLDIAVEVNPPLQGTDLRLGGAFARDARGRIHLCHTGKIGGGRRGISKTAFFEHYRGKLTEMSHARGLANVVDLGPVDSTRLPARLARFAKEVLRVKAAAHAAQTPHISSGAKQRDNRNKPSVFTPEFSGSRRAYARSGTTEAEADHGLVVDALVTAVERLHLVPNNDEQRALFVAPHRDGGEILFEVKTDVRTTSIYTAVGQLLLNGRAHQRETQLVLVVPAPPTAQTRDALGAIGIHVLEYGWQRGKPEISTPELRRLIR